MTDTSKYTASEGLRYEAGYSCGLSDARGGYSPHVHATDDSAWAAGYRDGYDNGPEWDGDRS